MSDDRENFSTAGGDPEETLGTPVYQPRGTVEDAVAADEKRYRSYREQIAGRLAKRPSGKMLINSGIALIVIGLIASVIAAMTPLVQDPGTAPIGDIYAGTPPVLNDWKYPVLWLGNAAVGLGILLWALGQVTRALFFLPGREVTIGELEA